MKRKTVKKSDVVVNAFPAGLVTAYMGSDIPEGWLECNGAQMLKGDYPELFAAIGGMYGSTATKFSLPDLRGYFLRGYDHGAGNDPDKASRTDRGDGSTGDKVGTKQQNQNGIHSHSYNYFATNSMTTLGKGNIVIQWCKGNATVNNTNSNGGSESRPKNINVMYIIKC